MNKTTRNTLLFVLFIIFFVIGCIYFYNQSTYRTRFAQNWDNIKGDFEIINDLAIDFFEKNNVNTINVYEFKKSLNNEQIAVFERASNNYSKYNDYNNAITKIENKDGIISYYDWEGNGYLERIVYSKLSKSEIKKVLNKGERHYIIEDLGDNWYYLDEHHL